MVLEYPFNFQPMHQKIGKGIIKYAHTHTHIKTNSINLSCVVRFIIETPKKRIGLQQRVYLWKLNPRDRSITLTKLLIKHAKFTEKETEIGA